MLCETCNSDAPKSKSFIELLCAFFNEPESHFFGLSPVSLISITKGLIFNDVSFCIFRLLQFMVRAFLITGRSAWRFHWAVTKSSVFSCNWWEVPLAYFGEPESPTFCSICLFLLGCVGFVFLNLRGLWCSWRPTACGPNQLSSAWCNVCLRTEWVYWAVCLERYIGYYCDNCFC